MHTYIEREREREREREGGERKRERCVYIDTYRECALQATAGAFRI